MFVKLKKCLSKINNKKGETIPEALVSVGVIAISLCALALTITTAMNVSTNSNERINTFYEQEGLVAASIYEVPELDSGISSSNVTVTMDLYENNQRIDAMHKSLTLIKRNSDKTNLFTITR